MKWQQRIRVATGLFCWQIMLHFLIAGMLLAGWMSDMLVYVGLALCMPYCISVAFMLVFQHIAASRWRIIGDVLDELTTTWYFGVALIALWLLSRVLHNNLLLTIAGAAVLAGPLMVSLMASDKTSGHLASKQRIRR